MFEKQFDNITVQIEYNGHKGSGVLYQPDTENYSFLITAAHCLYGDELIDKDIDLGKIEVFRQKNGNMEKLFQPIIDITKCLEKDVALLTLEYVSGIGTIYLKQAESKTEVLVMGFPQALDSKSNPYKRSKLNGYVNELPEADVLQINIRENMEIDGCAPKDIVSGVSGSGIFVEQDDNIYLLGIVTDLFCFNGVYGNSLEVLQGMLERKGFCVLQKKPVPKADNLQRVSTDKGYASCFSHTISDNIIAMVKGEDNGIYPYRECIDWMEQKQIPCIQILGEGGTGKTSFLMKTAEYLEGQPKRSVCYIRLNDINEQIECQWESFLENEMEKLAEFEERREEQPVIILLLDGFNEVKSAAQYLLASQIKKLRNQRNIRIMITSRRKIDGTVGIYGIPSFVMEGLTDRQISDYLLQQKMEPEKAVHLSELLRNPMMLTVYAGTNGEWSSNKEIEYFRFYEDIQTRGELISNYLESLAAKRYMQIAGGSEMKKELVLLLFVLYFVLPCIASLLEVRQEFSIDQDTLLSEIDSILLKQEKDKKYVTNWFARRGIPDISMLGGICTAEVVEYLKNYPAVFYKEKNWRYSHHNYRDELAARYFVMECEKGVGRKEIPGILYQTHSEAVLEFVGELSGQHKMEGHKRSGDILHEVVNLLRGKKAEEIQRPLYHILQVWKGTENNLAGEDFSNLDLKGQILEPYIHETVNAFVTNFTDAVIYPENLLPAGHGGIVSMLCYSPRGDIMATADTDGLFCFWDAYTYQLIQKFKMGDSEFLSGLTFSNDGKLAAAATFSCTYIWEVERGELKYCLKGHGGEIISHIAFHPYGRELASGGQDGNICVWDMNTGKRILHLGHNITENLQDYCRNSVVFCYSPNGKFIAAGYEDGWVRLWDAQKGKEIYSFPAHKNEILDIKYSADGELLATAGRDDTPAIWMAEDGRKIHDLKGHTSGTFEINFNEDAALAATASMDMTVRIWETKTGRCMQVLKGHKDFVQKVRFHTTGGFVVTAGCDGMVGVWRISDGKLLQELREHTDIVTGMQFYPDGQFLATSSLDENVYIWSTSSWKLLHRLKRNGKRVLSFIQAPGQKILTTDTPEDTARVWDIPSRRCLWKKENVYYKSCFRPRGTDFCELKRDGTIWVWDTECDVTIWKKNLVKDVSCIEYSPDGSRLLVLSEADENKEKEVQILSADTGNTIKTLEVAVSKIEQSAAGEYLAGINDSGIYVWRCLDWVLIAEYSYKRTSCLNVRFVRGAHFLAAEGFGSKTCFLGYEENAGRIVPADDGEKSKSLWNETFFNFTVTDDNKIKTWQYHTGEAETNIILPKGTIKEIKYHSNGYAAALYKQGRLIIWNMEKSEILTDIQTTFENIWKITFDESGESLLFASGPLIYELKWKSNQCQVLVDQRYEERLKGCNLQQARFDSSMDETDIQLLKMY